METNQKQSRDWKDKYTCYVQKIKYYVKYLNQDIK